MPAKTKYLSNPWQRFSKISAAIFGGYLVTMLIHLALTKMVADEAFIIMTTAYSAFLMWVFFMVITFFIKKAWHVWGVFGLIAILCSTILLM